MKLLAALLLALCCLSPRASADPTVITLFNWPDYIDPAVLDAFNKETGIRVHEINYQSDDLKDDLLLETHGEGFDIICSATASMENYVRKGWVLPIDKTVVTNTRHVAGWIRDNTGILKDFTVPYMWGSMGIAYRKDKVNIKVKGWRDLVVPDPAFDGRILMFNDSSELVAMALKTLKASTTTGDQRLLDRAEQLLMQQRPHVRRYGYEILSDKAAIVHGDIWMTPLYNGDALILQAYEPNIEFIMPDEGSWMWIDYMAVLKSSHHRAEAMQFLNYLHRPDVAARLSEFLKFATTNESAWSMVPKDIRDNPVIYTPDQIRKKVIFSVAFPMISWRDAMLSLPA